MRGARIVISTSNAGTSTAPSAARSAATSPASIVWVAEAGVAGAYAGGVLVLLRISVTWLRSDTLSARSQRAGSASRLTRFGRRGRRVRRRRTCRLATVISDACGALRLPNVVLPCKEYYDFEATMAHGRATCSVWITQTVPRRNLEVDHGGHPARSQLRRRPLQRPLVDPAASQPAADHHALDRNAPRADLLDHGRLRRPRGALSDVRSAGTTNAGLHEPRALVGVFRVSVPVSSLLRNAAPACASAELGASPRRRRLRYLRSSSSVRE